jgi:hypothetical protein
MPYNTESLADHDVRNVNWLDDRMALNHQTPLQYLQVTLGWRYMAAVTLETLSSNPNIGAGGGAAAATAIPCRAPATGAAASYSQRLACSSGRICDERRMRGGGTDSRVRAAVA